MPFLVYRLAMAFPTLIMMKSDASIVDQWSGYSPAPQFIERVKQALRKGGMNP